MIRSPAGYDGDIRIKRYQDYYQASYGVMMLSAGQVAFSPIDLFASGAPGVWYDPNDLSTMFQDAAGTTPVTAVEQPVGLRLDKSRGLVLGPELVTNGDFSNGTTGWTAVNGTLSVVDGRLVATQTSASFFTANTTLSGLTVGSTYRLTATVVAASGSSNTQIWVGSSAGAAQDLNRGAEGTTVPYTRSYVFVAGATSRVLQFVSNATSGTLTIDNISVRELPGSHAFQTTDINRPVLSARYNLLTRTEEFDNAVWTQGAVTVSTDQTTAPDGTSTADLVAETATSNTHQIFPTVSLTTGVSYTAVFHLKKGSGASAPNWMRLVFRSGAMSTVPWANFNISTGVVGNTSGANVSASIAALANGWYRCAITSTADTTSANGGGYVQFVNNSDSTTAPTSNIYLGSTAANVFLWGADLRVSNDGVGLPNYQRVTGGTEGSGSGGPGTITYDTTGFPLYLRYNGTNSTMQTAAIDFSSTDKMSVFAGVRKLSDAAQMMLELSSSATSNNGTFLLNNWTDTKFYFGSRGTTYVEAGSAAQAAPLTAVIVGTSNIAGPSIVLRQNSSQVGTNTSSQGTGNYGSAYPLYIGSRGSSSNWFNGRDYGICVLGRTATAAEITSMETWLNARTAAYA